MTTVSTSFLSEEKYESLQICHSLDKYLQLPPSCMLAWEFFSVSVATILISGKPLFVIAHIVIFFQHKQIAFKWKHFFLFIIEAWQTKSTEIGVSAFLEIKSSRMSGKIGDEGLRTRRLNGWSTRRETGIKHKLISQKKDRKSFLKFREWSRKPGFLISRSGAVLARTFEVFQFLSPSRARALSGLSYSPHFMFIDFFPCSGKIFFL